MYVLECNVGLCKEQRRHSSDSGTPTIYLKDGSL